MFRVDMIFNFDGEYETYEYGTYEDRNKANEVAMWVRKVNECDVNVVEV